MGSSSRAARAVPVLAASLALPLTLATSTACSTYSVRKSALTPHIAPPMRSGFGLADAAAEASFGASTLATTNPPEEGPDANAGIHIPRLELGGALRGRLTDSLDLGFVWDQGLRQGAYKTSPDQPSPGGGSVYGGGASLFASIPTAEPSFRVGVGVDLMIYSIPFVEYRTCVENCGGKPYSTVDHDREEIGVYGLSLIPSWRSGRLTLFAGGTVRNHPTVAKGEIEGDIELDDEVRAGPVNLLVSGGAELELGAGVRAMGMVYQTLTDQPVRYWPTFAVGLTIPLGRRAPAPSPGGPAVATAHAGSRVD